MPGTMADYLGAVTPDYDGLLAINPQTVLLEEMGYNQSVHVADDGSREVINLADEPILYIDLQWDVLKEDDARIISDFYMDPAKAKGQARSFLWAHPYDGHRYVVQFCTDVLKNSLKPARIYGVATLRLAVLGTADA